MTGAPSDRAFRIASIASLVLPLLLLALLVGDTVVQAMPRLTWDFLMGYPSRFPERAGIFAALAGSTWLLFLIVPATDGASCVCSQVCSVCQSGARVAENPCPRMSWTAPDT